MSAMLLLALVTTSCKIDQNREEELPEVDVDVDTEAKWIGQM